MHLLVEVKGDEELTELGKGAWHLKVYNDHVELQRKSAGFDHDRLTAGFDQIRDLEIKPKGLHATLSMEIIGYSQPVVLERALKKKAQEAYDGIQAGQAASTAQQ